MAQAVYRLDVGTVKDDNEIRRRTYKARLMRDDETTRRFEMRFRASERA